MLSEAGALPVSMPGQNRGLVPLADLSLIFQVKLETD